MVFAHISAVLRSLDVKVNDTLLSTQVGDIVTPSTELITEYSEIEVVLGVKVKLWTSGTHQNSEQLPFKRTHLYI